MPKGEKNSKPPEKGINSSSKKREASSPLNECVDSISDNSIGQCVTGETGETGISNIGQNPGRTGKGKKKRKQNLNANVNTSEINSQHFVSNSTPVHGFVYPYGAMAYPQQSPFSMSQPSFVQSPPPVQFGFPPTQGQPPWAADILDEMKQIRLKLESIEKIEKTVNTIHLKVSSLETKFSSLEARVTETER